MPLRRRLCGGSLDIWVTCSNDADDRLDVPRQIDSRGYSRAMDISANNRFIHHVTFTYSKLRLAPTLVELYGGCEPCFAEPSQVCWVKREPAPHTPR